MPLDTDWRIRLAAFARLSALHQQKGGSDLATAAELNEGFEFEGQRIRLVDLRRGIWKPRKADAALTLFTTPPKTGQAGHTMTTSMRAPATSYTGISGGIGISTQIARRGVPESSAAP